MVVQRGSIHAIVGENGAGKSTFGKLVAGLHCPDGGELLVDGHRVNFHSSRDALLAGITIVGQERTVIPQTTVIENVFLGRERHTAGIVNGKALRVRYASLCEASGSRSRRTRASGRCEYRSNCKSRSCGHWHATLNSSLWTR